MSAKQAALGQIVSVLYRYDSPLTRLDLSTLHKISLQEIDRMMTKNQNALHTFPPVAGNRRP